MARIDDGEPSETVLSTVTPAGSTTSSTSSDILLTLFAAFFFFCFGFRDDASPTLRFPSGMSGDLDAFEPLVPDPDFGAIEKAQSAARLRGRPRRPRAKAPRCEVVRQVRAWSQHCSKFLRRLFSKEPLTPRLITAAATRLE